MLRYIALLFFALVGLSACDPGEPVLPPTTPTDSVPVGYVMANDSFANYDDYHYGVWNVTVNTSVPFNLFSNNWDSDLTFTVENNSSPSHSYIDFFAEVDTNHVEVVVDPVEGDMIADMSGLRIDSTCNWSHNKAYIISIHDWLLYPQSHTVRTKWLSDIGYIGLRRKNYGGPYKYGWAKVDKSTCKIISILMEK